MSSGLSLRPKTCIHSTCTGVAGFLVGEKDYQLAILQTMWCVHLEGGGGTFPREGYSISYPTYPPSGP